MNDWHKIKTKIPDEYKDIQGCINARIVKLHEDGDIKGMKAYAAKLDEGQRNQARSHLKTCIAREKQRERDNHKTGE